MPNPATVREQRLRLTKAQLIDEIDRFEQRAAAIEAAYRSDAPLPAKASDGYLADRELADLARFPSENPNPVLRVMPDGRVLYANEAARAVKGLLKGRKKSTLARNLAGVCAQELLDRTGFRGDLHQHLRARHHRTQAGRGGTGRAQSPPQGTHRTEGRAVSRPHCQADGRRHAALCAHHQLDDLVAIGLADPPRAHRDAAAQHEHPVAHREDIT